MILTCLCTMVSSFLVSSQLPPDPAAISMITDPGCISSTVSLVRSKGAFFPGIWAVQITTFDFTACSWINFCCLDLYSSVCSTAYPPAPTSSVDPSTSINFPPRLITSSFTAGLTSNTSTTAPSFLAVASACRPATPAPSMSTFEGLMVPDADMNMGKKLGSLLAATSTAL